MSILNLVSTAVLVACVGLGCGKQQSAGNIEPAPPTTSAPSITAPTGSNDPTAPSDPSSPSVPSGPTLVQITVYSKTKTVVPFPSFPSKSYTATGYCVVDMSITYCWDDGVKSVTTSGLTTYYTYWGVFKNGSGGISLGNSNQPDFMATPITISSNLNNNLPVGSVSSVLAGTAVDVTCTELSNGNLDCGSFTIDIHQVAF